MHTGDNNTRMDDNVKNYPDSERPPAKKKGISPNKIQNDIVFAFDVKDPNLSNERRDL